MKRLLLIPLLALPLIAQPVPTVNVTGTARVGAIWPHDLTFEWHCESTTAEYSVGDAVASFNGTAVITNTTSYDGASSLYVPTSADFGLFDIAADDLANQNEGTLELYANVQTVGSMASLIFLRADTTNSISVTQDSTNALRLKYQSVGGTVYAKTPNTFETNVWFRVVAKWQKSATPYLSIALGDGEAGTYSTTALTNMNTELSSLRVGEAVSASTVEYIDNVRLWNIYK